MTSFRLRWLLVLLMVVALTAAACGGGDDALNSQAAANTTVPPAPAAEAPAEEAGRGGAEGQDGLGSGGVVPVNLQVVDLGRDIIFTAELTVAVADVATAGAEASRVVESFGGFLFGQQTTGGPEAVSVLTFKVQPEDFQQALDELGAIGELRTQNVSADDVTERVVDLESRISTAEASVVRLKGFLDEANDIVTITELEAQLLDRETQLETMRGQLRTIRDRIDLATIVLTLTEALANPALSVELSAYPGHSDAGLSCPGSGDLAVEKGDDVTVCVAITNGGDTPLRDFDVTDAVLGLELDDLIVVFGDLETAIEPGQSIDLAAEITVERSVRSLTRVTATPVGPEGQELEARSVASTSSLSINAVEPDGLPGFGDGVSAAVEVLAWIGGVIVLVAGFVLPFIWLVIPLGLWYWWMRRHRAARARAVPAPQPPPPPPHPPAVDGGEEDISA